jgi:hypothetical protein
MSFLVVERKGGSGERMIPLSEPWQTKQDANTFAFAA